MLIYFTTIFIIAVVYLIRQQYSYWQRRKFPYDETAGFPFGALKSVVKREKSMGMAVYDVYKRSKERFVGIYFLFRPAILVRDVELVRHVLAQDFASFHDRGIYVDEEKNPLSANLFSLRGQSWRTMRMKLTPSFTSGKLKGMFGTSEDISDKMIEHLNSVIPEKGYHEINIKDVFTKYAIDIIASVIFGLEINSFKQPDNKFLSIINKTRRKSFIGAIVGTLIFLCPSIASILFHLGMKNNVGMAVRDIIKDTIEYREKHGIVRKDLLQLLMQLRNTGKVNEDDDNWNAQSKADQFKSMSYELISAQAFIFYIAGQETTASTAAFTIFELAQYPELLARAQKEVEDVLEQTNNKIDYETLKKMPFLDLCIKETIRKYPGLPILNRECTQDYQIPNTDHIIQKGTPVVISLFGMHRDPEYFPDPERYDPERFLESNRNYNPAAYMPFGEGPRICIAQRMGKMNAKLAVFKILQNFDIEITDKRDIIPDNHSIALIPKGGVTVKLSRKSKK